MIPRVYYRSGPEEIARELKARNALALFKFRERRAALKTFIDPCSRDGRELMDAWYAMKREMARRWLFLRRIDKRAIAKLRGNRRGIA